MSGWGPRDRRARVKAAVAARFNPRLWSLNDQIIGVAAVAAAISVFLPWYKAIVRVGNSALSGFLIQPRGTASGLTVHAYLWAIFGLALVQFALLMARNAPGRRPRTIPGYGVLLLVTSAISLALALAAFVLKPSTWYGGNALGEGIHIVVSQDYGAIVAIIAALASVVVAWTVLRDPAAR